MKRTDLLNYLAAILFAIAAIIGFVKDNILGGVIGVIGCLSFVLNGIHWRRKNR